MGYLATNGVINARNGLADLNIPTGQVMQPSATTSFSMTQNLDSASAIGATASGQVQVYDSLGKSYEATVTYTNLGNNKWSYAITLPDTLTAAPATAPVPGTTMAVTAAPSVPTSVTAATTVAEPATTVPSPVTASTPAIVSTSPDLTPVKVDAPVTTPAVGLVTTGPTLGITTNTYTFDVNGTVKAGTKLVLDNVPNVVGGGTQNITVTPSVADESVTAFFTDITNALATANPAVIIGGNTGVTVTNPTPNTLVIAAPAAVTIDGTTAVNQDVALTTRTFNFANSNGALAQVGPSTGVPPTNLTIQIGTGAVISAPTFTTNESVTAYAQALQTAVGPPATSGVTITPVTLAGQTVPSQITITGPTNNMTVGGNIVQNFSGTKTNFTLGSYTDPTTGLITQAGIDGSTSLTFLNAPTVSGGVAGALNPDGTHSFSVSPTTSGESLAAYVTDIQAALTAKNVSGVTVAGVNGVLSIVGPSGMSITGPGGLGTAPIFNQDTLGTTIASSVTPTSPVTTTSTVPLPAALITPPSSSTTTLSPLAPTTSQVTGILPVGSAAISHPAVTTPAAVITAVNNSPLTPQAGGAAGTLTYNFAGSGAKVDNSTNLVFSIPNGAGGTVDITAPNVGNLLPQPVTVAAYATALQGAITTAYGGPGSAVSATSTPTGQLSITGGAIFVSGSVSQDYSQTASSYNFAPNATIDSATATSLTQGLTITGPSVTGGAYATTSVPVITGNPTETVNAYATDLNNALTAAGIYGVTVTGTNATGVLSITGPSTMVINNAADLKQNETITNYNFVSLNTDSAATDPANVDPATTTLKIGGTGATFASNTPISVGAYATLLQNAIGLPAVSGITVTGTNGVLSITAPTGTAITGVVGQEFNATNYVYNFGATGTVSTSTDLKITGPKIDGTTGSTLLPTFSGTPETVTDYATDLTLALNNAKIIGVTVTPNAATGQLTITGPGTITPSGTIAKDLDLVTTNYNFVTNNDGSQAMVSPNSTLVISEPNLNPALPSLTASVPAFTSPMTVANYATALQSALTAAGITDITVNGASGVLSITGPSGNNSAGVAAMSSTGSVVQEFSGEQSSFDFGSYTDPNTGLTQLATVAPTTSLTITAPTTAGTTVNVTVTPSNPAGESVQQYRDEITAKLATANVTGVNVTVSNGTMTITGPGTAVIAGTVNQNMLGTTSNYSFQTGSTVDPTTNLKITGLTANGSTAIITAPTVTAGETVAQYAAALNSAITTAGIQNTTVSAANGQLSIVGANLSTTGTLNQGLANTTITYNFGSSATVDPATALTITGPTVSGTPPTAITVAPPVTAGETVADYAKALTKALTTAGINTGADGVSITVDGGQLSIVGPQATLKTAGIASQDLTATTISYNFGTSGNSIATVDPKTNLTITGLTASGSTATTTPPTVTAGESLAQYVNDLTTALTTAGIAGVTVASTAAGQLSITGANLSTAGTVIQDPVSSANSNGTLTFDANGSLVNPTTNLSNITFAGLSDSAATMNMNWGLYGSTGKAEISQTASASTQSAQNQNGYTSGSYQSFTIGSSGTITAAYSNGQNQIVGQIGLASMSNLQGLSDVGSTEYQTTTASGLATVGVAGSGGLGTLEGSSLEASNVNISAEFSDLIIAQRAFEANSKAVTTFDTITQETINMIH
ncbi:MAG: flagellar hook-basal body complex protein [Terracidiphilus sp.]